MNLRCTGVFGTYIIFYTLNLLMCCQQHVYIGFWKEPDDGIDKPGI